MPEGPAGGPRPLSDSEIRIAYNLKDVDVDPELFSLLEDKIQNRTMNLDESVRVVPTDDDMREGLVEVGGIVKKVTGGEVETGDIQVLTNRDFLPQSDIDTIHKIVEETIIQFPKEFPPGSIGDERGFEVSPSIISSPILLV